MKAITGSSHEARGFALLVLVLLLSGGALAGGLFLSHRDPQLAHNRWLQEEAVLASLTEGFVRAVQTGLVIPDASDCWTAIAQVTGMNQTTMEWVNPAFPADPSNRRILLIDGVIAPGVLPYVQSAAGLSVAQSSLLKPRARAMFLSTTRRDLFLPVRGGETDPAAFDAIWNWAYDAAKPSSPSGWPAAWASQGATLHVSRISLHSLFAQVHLNQLRYGVGSGSFSGGTVAATEFVKDPTIVTLLKGSLLAICQTNGIPHQVRVVRRDAMFDLTTPSDPRQGTHGVGKDGPR